MPSLKKRFPVYSKVLKLYPKAYLRKYYNQTLQTTADMLDDDGLTLFGKLKIWFRVGLDLAKTIPLENIKAIDAKKFIPRSLIVCILLMLPLVLNLLYVVFAGSETLATYNPIIIFLASPIFVIFMPIIATILAITGIIVWKINRPNIVTRKLSVRPSLVALVLIAFIGSAFLILIAGSWLYFGHKAKNENNTYAQNMLKNPTLACKILPEKDAKNIAGDKVRLDSISSATNSFNGAIYTDKNIDWTNCSYVKGNYLGVMSTVKAPQNAELGAKLKDEFFTNIAEGEKPITIHGLNGFYSYDTMRFVESAGNIMGSANIRLWVNNHWLEATALTFEQADRTIALMSDNLNKYLAAMQDTTDTPPNDITGLTEAERMAITQAVQNQEPTVIAGTTYTVNINGITGKQITGSFSYTNGLRGTFAVEKKQGRWQVVAYEKTNG